MTKRYLLVKAVSDHEVTDEQFREALDNSVRKYLGELGFARIDPRVIRFNPGTSTGIVSCERDGLPELESAMALVTGQAESQLSLLVLRVSGTIKAVRGKR